MHTNTHVNTLRKDLHVHTTLTLTLNLLGFSCPLDKHRGLLFLTPLQNTYRYNVLPGLSQHGPFQCSCDLQFVTILFKQLLYFPIHTLSPWWLLPCLSFVSVLKNCALHTQPQVCWMTASNFYWVERDTVKTMFYPSDCILLQFQIVFWNRYNSKANGTNNK